MVPFLNDTPLRPSLLLLSAFLPLACRLELSFRILRTIEPKIHGKLEYMAKFIDDVSGAKSYTTTMHQLFNLIVLYMA